MRRTIRVLYVLAAAMLTALSALAAGDATGNRADDAYLWLEQVEGSRALDWVRQQNKASLELFEADPRYEPFKSVAEKILQDKERIPYPSLHGDYVYNFWRDADHIRGIWRRTPVDRYAAKDVPWQTLVDLDALAEREGENWVFKAVTPLEPESRRWLIELSRGGKDAVVTREFDVERQQFVPDGFHLAEAKSTSVWLDADTLVVGSDFGPGSLTTSGYPRVLKLWRRGQPLDSAPVLFEGKADDVGVAFYRDFTARGYLGVLARNITFYESKYSLLVSPEKQLPLAVPNDAELAGFFQGRLLLRLRSDWKRPSAVINQGALVAVRLDNIVQQRSEPHAAALAVETLYSPDDRSTLVSVGATKSDVVVSLLENVTGKAVRLEPRKPGEAWKSRPIDLPEQGAIDITSTNEFSDRVFLSFQSYLTPERLYLDQADSGGAPVVVKSLPEKFDAAGFRVESREATSKDGTRIPYFVIGPRDMELDGSNPTVLYGYGGFEIPLTPRYLALEGNLWLQQGGVYVVANIRGGGEFGPRWHRAALLENRQRAYDDFIAVAESLVAEKITSPEHLGIYGGSNGGLLVGVAFTQRPELFKAVVCAVPLLDMFRYTKLLAGASWMAEYGDPQDPRMATVIGRYSPYQNVRPGAKYPEVFFLTSTKDDRVHPGHARKMVAKMTDQGHRVYYYENIEGGHGAAANLLQQARRYALMYVYFHRKLAR